MATLLSRLSPTLVGKCAFLTTAPVTLDFISLREVATFSFDYNSLSDSYLWHWYVNSFNIEIESCVSHSARMWLVEYKLI